MTASPELPSARVEAVMPAPPQRVFDAWLDERALKQFMCPAPGHVAEVAVEPHIGGQLRIVMAFPDRRIEIAGNFVALDRPDRLSFTWHNSADGADSIVTVLFAPRGEDQTQMTIIHSLQPALIPSYRSGWTSIAQALAIHLGA